jgi:hypothetical protein
VFSWQRVCDVYSVDVDRRFMGAYCLNHRALGRSLSTRLRGATFEKAAIFKWHLFEMAGTCSPTRYGATETRILWGGTI